MARDGAVAVVTIDRQDALNALNVETLTELRDRLDELSTDNEVRAVVLTGAGKAFVAGADIKYMSGLRPSEAKSWGGLGHEAGRLLETMAKPTIAAVNGFALGGGCELALACDIRFASSRAKLGQPEVNLGIVPGWGGTQRLARVCGIGVAKELIFTGRLVDADEALRIGLVSAIVIIIAYLVFPLRIDAPTTGFNFIDSSTTFPALTLVIGVVGIITALVSMTVLRETGARWYLAGLGMIGLLYLVDNLLRMKSALGLGGTLAMVGCAGLILQAVLPRPGYTSVNRTNEVIFGLIRVMVAPLP